MRKTLLAVRRRNGSLAALRDAQGSRSIDDTTSTVSAQPEWIAFTASMTANITTGDGLASMGRPPSGDRAGARAG